MGINQKILKNLPQKPGVYRFIDSKGDILYIGKTKNLRARVRQYFSGEDERPQIPYLMQEMADLDYTLVNNELESLYLERTLIQKLHPKYNIELKDDKNYAFIVIDYSTEIPQIIIQRKIQVATRYTLHATRSVYFGPFTSAKKIRDLIFTARRTFGLCSALKPGKPCFYFHLHRCPGVCAGTISVNKYNRHLDKIKLFLSGKIKPAKKSIEAEMRAAAKNKKFEKAARLRDQLRALENLEQKQNVIMTKPVDWDVIGIADDESVWCVNLFKIRGGRLTDKINFVYSDPADYGSSEVENQTVFLDSASLRSNKIRAVLQTFLEDYYSQTNDVGKKIYLPDYVDNDRLIKKLITNRFKKSVKLTAPKKGKVAELTKLSSANAREYLKNYLNEKAGHLDKIQRGLKQLKKILGLPEIPKRIEGYDISNLQGTNPVGSMVVFIEGLPKKSEYRKFKIRGQNTPDDFAMMREMLIRRFAHSVKDQGLRIKDNWPLPNLIVIDGGRGQLNAALQALSANHLALSTKIIGLAKRIEEIFLPGKKNPIILPHDNPGLQLLQHLRDEAHRFGIAFHRKLRVKQTVKSALDDIPGVGPKTKRLLKQKFGAVADIRKASSDDLNAVVGKKMAEKIKNGL